MTFTNSLELLAFHEVVYTIYAFLMLSIVGWFAYNITREGAKSIVRIPFYGYMAFLIIAGVGHHIFTYNTIPWVSEDITRDQITPDATYNFEITKHKWALPAEKIIIQCGQTIEFDVVSNDLMYGFGLFRQDGSLVTQMQVNPGSSNDILWTFHHNGIFDLVSTEYSGPDQYSEDGKEDLMKVAKYVEVVGCDQGGIQ